MKTILMIASLIGVGFSCLPDEAVSKISHELKFARETASGAGGGGSGSSLGSTDDVVRIDELFEVVFAELADPYVLTDPEMEQVRSVLLREFYGIKNCATTACITDPHQHGLTSLLFYTGRRSYEFGDLVLSGGRLQMSEKDRHGIISILPLEDSSILVRIDSFSNPRADWMCTVIARGFPERGLNSYILQPIGSEHYQLKLEMLPQGVSISETSSGGEPSCERGSFSGRYLDPSN